MRCFLLFSLLIPVLRADPITGGRGDPAEGIPYGGISVYGGIGGIQDLSGSVKETRDNIVLREGVNVDLEDLGLADDTETVFWGVQWAGRWATLLFDHRQTHLDAEGRADREFRLDVDGITFAGLTTDYLIIPVGTDYAIDATTDWFGLGIRITPVTLGLGTGIRFTPWAHIGLQVIQADYDVDAGATATLTAPGFDGRRYAERGRASGEAEAGIPEYGIGGQLRLLFYDETGRGLEVVGEATLKLLDFQGAIDSLGVDAEEFEDIDFTYTAIEGNVYLLHVGETVDIFGGLYLERVDVEADLERGDRFDYDREIDLSYTLIGVRGGVRF